MQYKNLVISPSRRVRLMAIKRIFLLVVLLTIIEVAETASPRSQMRMMPSPNEEHEVCPNQQKSVRVMCVCVCA